MLYLFIGSIVLLAASIFLVYWADDGYSGWRTAAGVLGGIGCFGGLVGLVITTILGIGYVGAGHQASIINREYGTNYTREEVFYASNVIATVRELDRRRFEVNGDFRRAAPDTKAQRDQRSYPQQQEQ